MKTAVDKEPPHTASQQKTQKRGPPRTVYYRGSYDPNLLRCMSVVSTGKTAVAFDGKESSHSFHLIMREER